MRFSLRTLLICALLAGGLAYQCTQPWCVEVNNGRFNVLYGWPLPAMEHRFEVRIEDHASVSYCCERCSGPFPIKVYEARPDLFETSPGSWDYSVLLLAADAVLLLALLFALGCLCEWAQRRRARRDTEARA
ncbi:MAG: hypothetical protein KIS92_12480 [Planctomycetota bacterium]|nr:hypothetical protein [Planctomycetota bacterium]